MGSRTTYEKNGLKKGAWSPKEDHKLRCYILRYGHRNWGQLRKCAGLARCGKSCRLRWMNYLKPDVKHGNFTLEEDDLIMKFQEEHGSRWAAIASKLPGRTDNDIKNHWHTHLKKKPIKQRPKTASRGKVAGGPPTDPSKTSEENDFSRLQILESSQVPSSQLSTPTSTTTTTNTTELGRPSSSGSGCFHLPRTDNYWMLDESCSVTSSTYTTTTTNIFSGLPSDGHGFTGLISSETGNNHWQNFLAPVDDNFCEGLGTSEMLFSPSVSYFHTDYDLDLETTYWD